MVGLLYSAVATTVNTLLYPTGFSIPTGPPRIRRSVPLTAEQMARRNAELSRLLDEDRDVEGGGAEGPPTAAAGGDDGGWHGGQAAPQMLTTEAGFCVECEAPAAMRCEQCDDEYCAVCFQALHRKGKRAKHHATSVDGGARGGAAGPSVGPRMPTPAPASMGEMYSPAWFVERAKYIPLRLSMKQRKGLRLLQSALKVCDYTDKIDVATNRNKAKRVTSMLRDVCALLSGTVVSVDYSEGQALVQSRDFENNMNFFRTFFEVGRRHKIMNPDAMRDEYGKLIYLLQDANSEEVQELLRFSCVNRIDTVHKKLEAAGMEALMKDPLVRAATMEIMPEGKPRHQIQREIKEKEHAVKQLSRRYGNSSRFNTEDVELCLYSIADNHAYLRYNRDPIVKMIQLLKAKFSPGRITEGYSLAITGDQVRSRAHFGLRSCCTHIWVIF